MSWLLALLAFAGIMAVLSTVVTGTVEALHKAFSLRRSGLQEMLRALHDGVLVDVVSGDPKAVVDPSLGGGSADAARFAKDMTRSPAYGGRGRWWWPSNWHINIFQRQFERLTPRQFAEQLGQTKLGQSLAEQDYTDVRHALKRATYEFDRFGVAQSQYFRRRAKVLSGVVAFAFVIFSNFNAIGLYMHLAQDHDARNNLLATLEGGDPAAVAILSAELQDQVALALQADASGATPDRDVVEQRLENIIVVRDQLLARAAEEEGLPVGMRYFPFCERDGLDAVDGFNADPERCTAASGQLNLLFAKVDAPEPVLRLAQNPANAVAWLLSMIASAGLLALGSPFWYQVFGRVAQMAGGAAKAAAAEVTDKPRIEKGQSRAGRGMEDPELDELTEAFLISVGDSSRSARAPARGMKLGASSPRHSAQTALASSAVPAASDGASDAGAAAGRASLRGVHGDWGGV